MEVREPFNLEEEGGRIKGMMMGRTKAGNKVPHKEGKYLYSLKFYR
jgi:hypothetical protein